MNRRCAAALVATLALAGCRGASGRTVDDGTTIRFWALGAEGEQVQGLVREFERANPGLHVRVQQVPWTAAHEKLLTAFVGEATPDVAQLGNTWVPEFSAVNALVPLDSLLAASSTVDSSDFFSGIWDTNVIHGVPFGVPWYVDTRVLFYRRDLLARAGWDSVPGTWAEWRKAMIAVQRDLGPGQHAIFLPTNEWTQPVIFGMQAGSPILKDDGQYGAFSDSAFRRGFDFYIGLFRAGLAPLAGANDLGNVYQEFERGNIAMWITGPWNIGEFRRRLPASMRDAWATAALPGPNGRSSGISLAGGSSLVIFRRTPHLDAAWKLVEFLSRPDVQLRFYRITGDLPARRSAWQDTTLIGDAKIHAFYDQLQRVVPTPKVPEWELITTRLIAAAEATIRGGVPPDSALARLDRDVDRILEKRRYLLARARARDSADRARPALDDGAARR